MTSWSRVRVLAWPARKMDAAALCLFACLLLGAVDAQPTESTGEVYDQNYKQKLLNVNYTVVLRPGTTVKTVSSR